MIDRLPPTDLSLGSPSSCYSFLWAAVSPWTQWSQCHRAGQTPSTHSCSDSPGTGHLPLQMAGQWSHDYEQINQVISCILFNVSIENTFLFSTETIRVFFSNFEELNIYRNKISEIIKFYSTDTPKWIFIAACKCIGANKQASKIFVSWQRRLTQWPQIHTDQTVHAPQMCSHTDCGWTWGFLFRPAGFCYMGWSLRRPLWTSSAWVHLYNTSPLYRSQTKYR